MAAKEKLAGPDGPQADDEVEASRAPLMEHLTELRTRLIWVLGAVALAFIACFTFAEWIYNVLLVPFENAARQVRGEDLQLQLIFTGPLEFFFVKLKLALFGAIIVAFPMIAYQVWAFVRPGLYKNERLAFAPFLIASPVLFAAGVASAGFTISAARIAAARPKTTRSISELEPRRLAPWTEAQPASPTAIRPGNTASGLPGCGFSTSPQ